MNNTQQNDARSAGAPPIAYFLVAAGGGVVGHDYANWLNVDPIVGAGIGGFISLILTKFLYHLYSDPEGKIRETCSGIGAFIGVIFGITTLASNSDGEMAWLIGAVVGGGIGLSLIHI